LLLKILIIIDYSGLEIGDFRSNEKIRREVVFLFLF